MPDKIDLKAIEERMKAYGDYPTIDNIKYMREKIPDLVGLVRHAEEIASRARIHSCTHHPHLPCEACHWAAWLAKVK